MSRALAYCAFCYRLEISLPSTGVTAADVRVMAEGELRLLWSEVEWPFAPERMQKNALEFHDVISHVFRQAAVIPFRLLSVFEDEKSLAAFTAEHAKAFLADLERLQDCVQMECVVFPAPSRKQTNNSSGADYLREKAAMLREQGEHVKVIQEGLSGLAREIQVREGKNGTRIFVLTERGREKEFRSIVELQVVPAALSRRISGPWPAAEFLSEQVRAPQVAGAK
ncbi:MAG TPA: GvpL/GvpF family gas vesicle protein [Candidatus Angelobacter sp.]|nr:GvpL/GvpF family gas vesicle protein [Candidatus Angelobacter sp.]